jgi:hypothetical protein
MHVADGRPISAPELMRQVGVRQDGQQELPGLENEVHEGPDAAAATSIASSLEGGSVKRQNGPTAKESQSPSAGPIAVGLSNLTLRGLPKAV